MQEEVKEPVSTFVLFARMFSIAAKNLEKEFGEKGLKVLEDSVKEFGIDRGKDIAARAKANGKENTLENYLDNYDMGRSEEFGYDTVYKQDGIHQDFHRCVFAKTWMDAVKKNTVASIVKTLILLSQKAITKIWNVYMTISCMQMVIAPSASV